MYVRRTPFEIGFFSEIHYIVGPLFIIFGLFLGYCIANDYAKISRASGWTTTSAKLTSVDAVPFNRNWFEPTNWFMKSATIIYAYNASGSDYTGATELTPQGIRYYDGLAGLSKSGDVATWAARDRAIADQARQSTGGALPPIGGWQKAKTPQQAAAPFAYASLDPQHVLQVKYNPAMPTESVLSDVLAEHAKKLSSWAFGSVILGILIIVSFRMFQSVQQGTDADDKIISDMYDRMNH